MSCSSNLSNLRGHRNTQICSHLVRSAEPGDPLKLWLECEVSGRCFEDKALNLQGLGELWVVSARNELQSTSWCKTSEGLKLNKHIYSKYFTLKISVGYRNLLPQTAQIHICVCSCSFQKVSKLLSEKEY